MFFCALRVLPERARMIGSALHLLAGRRSGTGIGRPLGRRRHCVAAGLGRQGLLMTDLVSPALLAAKEQFPALFFFGGQG